MIKQTKYKLIKWLDYAFIGSLLIALFILMMFFGFIVFSNILTGQTKYVVHCNQKLLETSHDTLLKQVGVRERTGNNDGYKVEQYLKSVGRFRGDAYCAAGQYWCFFVSAIALNMPDSIPICRTGLANGIYNCAKVKGRKTKYEPKKHDLLVWRKPNTSSGHIERVTDVGKAGWVKTVGFNTSAGAKGSQADGQGVFIRNRNVKFLLGKMQVRGLVGFDY